MNKGRLYFEVTVPPGSTEADRILIQLAFENALATVDPKAARFNWADLQNIPDPPVPAALNQYINSALAQTESSVTVSSSTPPIHYCSIGTKLICYQAEATQLNGSAWTFEVQLSTGTTQIPMHVVLASDIASLT